MATTSSPTRPRPYHMHSHGEAYEVRDWSSFPLGGIPLGTTNVEVIHGDLHFMITHPQIGYSAVLQDTSRGSLPTLHQRLDNANRHFRRKAAEVLNDEAAVLLLAQLYEQSTITLSGFDSCKHGVSLAKLTAANFCEVGANLIYITEAGQKFTESIAKNDGIA